MTPRAGAGRPQGARLGDGRRGERDRQVGRPGPRHPQFHRAEAQWRLGIEIILGNKIF